MLLRARTRIWFSDRTDRTRGASIPRVVITWSTSSESEPWLDDKVFSDVDLDENSLLSETCLLQSSSSLGDSLTGSGLDPDRGQ